MHKSVVGSGLLLALIIGSSGAAGAGSAGCSRPALQSGTYVMRYGGLERRYRVSVPPHHDAAHPQRLVMVFHGWGGDESEFLDEPGVAAEANRRGYVLVAPRGVGSGPPDGRRNSWTFRGSASGVVDGGAKPLPICDVDRTPDYTYPSCRTGQAVNTCSWTQCQSDDVGFARALIAHIEKSLCIDTAHVFAVGGSNGGMFTLELGTNPRTAPLLRAIGSIIGLPHRGDDRKPAVRSGIPLLLVTGTKDPVVPPGAWDDPSDTISSSDDDRFHYSGATAVVRRWSLSDGCPVEGVEQRFSVDYAQADCRAYCPAGKSAWPRVLDCRADMGHDYRLDWSWPLMLDFLDRW